MTRPMPSSGLHAAPGHAYCGPTALAAITGLTSVEIEQHILTHRKTNKPPYGHRISRAHRALGIRVKGLFATEIVPVAQACGWDAVVCPGAGTLAQWLRLHGKSGPWLVLVTGHFVAVAGGYLAESTRHRVPVPIAQAPYRRHRVVHAWRLISKQLTPEED